MKGITLIGMPGAGKSTIGKKLAKELGFDFVDLDWLIKEKEGQTHVQIMQEKGEEALKRLEEKYALELSLAKTVFSPGGSIIYSAPAMAKLADESAIIYLELPLAEIAERLGAKAASRGIVGLKEKGLHRLYHERAPLYRQNAHHIINCHSLNDEEIIAQILDL